MASRSTKAVSAVLVAIVVAGCLGQVGLYDPQEQDCSRFCTLVETTCTGSQRAYYSREACTAVCGKLSPEDEIGGFGGNTLACRLGALSGVDFDVPMSCAGVGAGGEGVCGSNCEALCSLREQVCVVASQAQQAGGARDELCLRQCRALRDLGNFDVERDSTGDTVQCRLLHVSEAGISPGRARTHCQHTAIIPALGERGPCSDPQELPKEQDCQSYCGLVMNACQVAQAVYESEEQCMSVCRLLDQGTKGDLSGDTIRCRRSQAYSALDEPATHCTLAGPTGDGHCGTGNCPGYCRILAQACPNAFAAAHGPGAPASVCESGCEQLDGAGREGFRRSTVLGYTTATSERGNGLLCRTYRAIRALAAPNDSILCAAAIGDIDTECR